MSGNESSNVFQVILRVYGIITLECVKEPLGGLRGEPRAARRHLFGSPSISLFSTRSDSADARPSLCGLDVQY